MTEHETERAALSHTVDCPFLRDGAVCTCGVIDSDLFEFVRHVQDAVLIEEDDDE